VDVGVSEIASRHIVCLFAIHMLEVPAANCLVGVGSGNRAGSCTSLDRGAVVVTTTLPSGAIGRLVAVSLAQNGAYEALSEITNATTNRKGMEQLDDSREPRPTPTSIAAFVAGSSVVVEHTLKAALGHECVVAVADDERGIITAFMLVLV
jgi:hypothetical protein